MEKQGSSIGSGDEYSSSALWLVKWIVSAAGKKSATEYL